jgi:hypothetical protein
MQRNRIYQIFLTIVLLSCRAAASPIAFETLPDFGQEYSSPFINLPVDSALLKPDPEMLLSGLSFYTLPPVIDDGFVLIDLPIVALAATDYFAPFIDLPISACSPQPSPVIAAPEPVAAVLIGGGLLIFSLIRSRRSRRP